MVEPGSTKRVLIVCARCGCGSKPMEYHFGVGAPPIFVYFCVDWDVHWGYRILTHGHVGAYFSEPTQFSGAQEFNRLWGADALETPAAYVRESLAHKPQLDLSVHLLKNFFYFALLILKGIYH